MRRFANTLPVNAKLYRHFAVVTVMLTVCIAIFADGENREYIAEQAAAQEAGTTGVAQQAKQPTRTKVNGLYVRDGKRPRPSSGGAPAPMGYVVDNQIAVGGGSSGGGSSAVMDPRKQIPEGLDASNRNISQVVEAETDANNEPEWQTVSGGPRPKQSPRKRGPHKPSEEEIRNLFDSSRSRSGSQSTDDDPN